VNPLLLEYLKAEVKIVYLHQRHMILFTSAFGEILTIHEDMGGYEDVRDWVLHQFHVSNEDNWYDCLYWLEIPPHVVDNQLIRDKAWRNETS
jgi:hypothetical protein